MNEDPSPLWEFVAPEAFQLPAAPVTQAARRGLRTLWQRISPGNAGAGSPPDPAAEQPDQGAPDQLERLNAAQLRQISPAPDWTEAAGALEGALHAWQDADPAIEPAVFLIAAPFSGGADALAAWAERQDWPRIDPPTVDQILDQDEGWVTSLGDAGRPWVLPRLERSFLRHVRGLALVRLLLDRIYASQIPRGVIGCDSWAWSYLQHIWRGRRPLAFTLQAFDAARLARWFTGLATNQGAAAPTFRLADNGAYIVPPPEAADGEVRTSAFLQSLAAHARGNPGVALACWQHSLRSVPDEPLQEEADEATGMGATLWVQPWNRLDFPALPPEASRHAAFILHSLLLHGGLPTEILERLLPFSASEINQTLLQLQGSGLLHAAAQRWQVTPLGYAAARAFLRRHDFLVDVF